MDRHVTTRKSRQWGQAFSPIVFMRSSCFAESLHYISYPGCSSNSMGQGNRRWVMLLDRQSISWMEFNLCMDAQLKGPAGNSGPFLFVRILGIC
jgi:hypothetical protein